MAHSDRRSHDSRRGTSSPGDEFVPAHAFESEPKRSYNLRAGPVAAATGTTGKKMFTRDIATMMYGFGDAASPNAETVDCIEDLVVQYIIAITEKAMEVNKTSRITVDDLLFVVRNEPRKYSRVKELLHMNEELKRMRKAFEEEKFELP